MPQVVCAVHEFPSIQLAQLWNSHFHSRGIPVGLYLTHTMEGCLFVASDCKANIIVVDSDQQMSKILSVSKGHVCGCVGGSCHTAVYVCSLSSASAILHGTGERGE